MRERLSSEIKDASVNQDSKPVEFNPLDEAVNEKTYTRANVSASESDLNKPIDEPRFSAPPINKKNPKHFEDEAAQSKKEPVNPEMKDIPKKETEMAAAQMAKLILQGYEWAHKLGNKGLQISDRKIKKLESEGEINLSALITYDYTKSDITAGEFIKEYNSQVENVLTVSEEFKEEVTPVLIRVLSKRGIGLTDEQYLMYLFGQDLAGKTMIFVQQKQQVNYMIDVIKEASVQQQTSRFSRKESVKDAPQPVSTNDDYDDEEAEIKNNFTEPEVIRSKAKDSLKPEVIIVGEDKTIKGRRGRRKITRE
jgi:hypothetical protein